MKLVVHPDYQHLTRFVSELPQTFEKEGVSIYKVRNELKVFDLDGLKVNVKAYRVPSLFNRFIYTYIRPTKASRAYENALRLIEGGFDTPAPIAYLECFSGGLIHKTYFVSLQCPYPRIFKEFADASDVGDRKAVVEALGRYVGRLHEAGILHKDLSIGNILFEEDEKGVHFSLVDLNRMAFRAIDMRDGCSNFQRLRGNEAFFKLLASSYAAARGFSEKECLAIIQRKQQHSVRYFSRKSTVKRKRRAFRQFWTGRKQ